MLLLIVYTSHPYMTLHTLPIIHFLKLLSAFSQDAAAAIDNMVS